MTGLREEYERLTTGSGYSVFSGWTCLRVTGRDRAAFLNNLCTNRVEGLAEGEGGEAFFTDVKGHILAHTLILNRPKEIFLWGVPGQAEGLLAHLDKYLIREDVQLEDLSQSSEEILIAGDSIRQVLEEVLGEDWSKELKRPSSSKVFTVGGVEGLAFRCDWFGPTAILLQARKGQSEQLAAALEGRGMVACQSETVDVLGLEQGTPYYGTDFDDKNLPQEVNRDGRAISLTKGCYLGQETVARIDALGHVNKLLVSLRFSSDTVPEKGTALFADDRDVGRVSSSCSSPRHEAPIGLAIVRRGSNEPGTQLQSSYGTAEVVRLP